MTKGGNTVKMKEEMETRRKLITDHLIENANSSVKLGYLTTLFGVSDWTMRKDCVAISESNPAVKLLRGAVMYIPPTRYSGNRNDEGYADPTASSAIGNTPSQNASGFVTPKAGDVWDVRCSTGKTEKYIIIAINDEDEYATCIKYCPEAEDMKKSCKKIYSKPLKYFEERTWGTPLSQLTKYKNMIRDYLGIDAEVRVEEKIKIERVEVPVEIPVVQEGCVECTSDKIYTQADMDRTRADIYKECLYLMAGRKEI